MNFGTLLFLILSPLASCQKPKILALHGGGGTGEGFSQQINDIVSAMPEYEFVFGDGAYGNSNSRLWIPDPPGGKDEPTTDPGFSDDSINALDELRESEGPFAGIIGYSQGAAYVSVYLSRVPVNTFQFAASFCGYPTLTHQGILGVVNEQKPFGDIPMLIWMGGRDRIISNDLSSEQIEFYTNPTVIVSQFAGHIVPGNSDQTFDQVISFLKQNSNSPSQIPGTSSPTLSLTPTLQPVTPAPTTTQSPSDIPVDGVYISKVSENLKWTGKKWTGILGLVIKLNDVKVRGVTVLAEYSLGNKTKQKKCTSKKNGLCKLKLPKISYKVESIDVSLVEITSNEASYEESLNVENEDGCPVFSENCPSLPVYQPDYEGKGDAGK